MITRAFLGLFILGSQVVGNKYLDPVRQATPSRLPPSKSVPIPSRPTSNSGQHYNTSTLSSPFEVRTEAARLFPRIEKVRLPTLTKKVPNR
ncbi:hypothetical protein QBC45DRAFT_426683 [Copromyces sp. CBS 386.78]|nr:hypothetical protein QBC45DRAFT_426683 [Copromyces sp. CBS 386.78]